MRIFGSNVVREVGCKKEYLFCLNGSRVFWVVGVGLCFAIFKLAIRVDEKFCDGIVMVLDVFFFFREESVCFGGRYVRFFGGRVFVV